MSFPPRVHPRPRHLCLLLVAVAARAHAQPPPPAAIDVAAPTRGLTVPGGAIAGDADATSLILNPGQLGYLASGTSALVFNLWTDEVEREGRGLGWLTTFSLPANLHLGLGLEWLQPSRESEPDDVVKLDLGLAIRLGRAIGFGLTYERFFSWERYDGLGSLSLGYSIRPHDLLAAGIVVRDLFRPRPIAAGERVPRELDTELALRPLGTPRLELAGGLRMISDDHDTRYLPHGRLAVAPLRGLTLFADGEIVRTRVRLIGSEWVRRPKNDFRLGAGLVVSFGTGSLTAATVGTWRRNGAGENMGDETGGLASPGVSIVTRSGLPRAPALIHPVNVARVKLEGLDNDRSFLAALVGLRRLADDRAAGAVLLVIHDLGVGYGRIEELRQAVQELARRKPVFAHLSLPGTREYYLASAAHKLAIQPAGGLELSGLAQSVTFWKGAMDKLGVAVDVVRIAEYKGAVEPFIRTEQSEPVRANRLEILDQIFAHVVAGIAQGRQLDRNRVLTLIDQALLSPAEARNRGLVDAIADEREMEELVKKSLGRNVAIRDPGPRLDPRRWQPRRVAVIVIDGAITSGSARGLNPTVGEVAWSDPIIEALAQVRRDPSVRAVVIRVNSPGGSAFASDRIYREVKRLREARKPIVVSMGDSAASGGYYVAAPAESIIASPATVTGSIGIFALKPDVSGLAGKLGVHTEISGRGAHAALYSPWKPWTDEERAIVTSRIGQSYKQFLGLVIEHRKSRGVTDQRADAELGRGRIFTGAQAKNAGLVDRLGSFTDALEEAAARGRVPTGQGGLPEIVVLPRPPIDTLASLLALRNLISAEEPAPVDLPTTALTLFPQAKGVRRLLVPLLLAEPNDLVAALPFALELD